MGTINTEKNPEKNPEMEVEMNPEREPGDNPEINPGKKPAYDGVYNRYVKRLLDIVLSGIGILILWPLCLIVAVAVALDDGFPVMYRADRGGYKNKTFRICKFRTMVRDADKMGGTTALHDSRITKVGNVLRKTKLDELPQLFQVFTGKMSLIGPRPELLLYTDRYEGDEKLIFEVRPGITDYSSLKYINQDEIVGEENPVEMFEKYILKPKNQLRIHYARTVSFRADCEILVKTIWAVLKKAFGFVVKKEHR